MVRSSQSQVGEKPTLVRHKDSSDAIHVIDRSREGRRRISRVCPKCGNNKAYHWVSRVSGEHAGIHTERTIEHFRCTRCSHTWGRNA
ncbi:MAG: hypothetical protein NWE78_08520 [Candidatus Bathyarchaeota archaeon]|nr:hypothetical protein [Candidatus Bathyarchaeota archaeon]